MIQEYRYHKIKVQEPQLRNPKLFGYEITGHFFRSRPDGSKSQGFSSFEAAIAAAQEAIDQKFEQEACRANLRRYLVEQDYEYFIEYLASKDVPTEQIHLIASTLTLSCTQKESITEELTVRVRGEVDVDARVSGSINTYSESNAF